MDTDDDDPGKPSSLNELREGEQPQDLLPGQPQAHEVELDPYGVPVRVRPANGRTYLLAAGCLICGGVCAGLGVMNHLAKLPGYLVFVGVLSGLLSTFAYGFFGPPLAEAKYVAEAKNAGQVGGAACVDQHDLASACHRGLASPGWLRQLRRQLQG